MQRRASRTASASERPAGDLVERRAPPGRVERARLERAFRRARSPGRARHVPNRTTSPSARAAVFRSPTTGSPRRNWPMDTAASRPAATARTAAPGPATHSPPAKTPSRFVASVCRSAAMPRAETFRPSFLKNSVSARRGGAAINRPASREKVAPSRSSITRTTSPPVDVARAACSSMGRPLARAGAQFQLDAFGLGGVNPFAEAGHALARRLANQRHAARSEPQRRLRRRHRLVAPPRTTTDSRIAGLRPSATCRKKARACPHRLGPPQRRRERTVFLAPYSASSAFCGDIQASGRRARSS